MMESLNGHSHILIITYFPSQSFMTSSFHSRKKIYGKVLNNHRNTYKLETLSESSTKTKKIWKLQLIKKYALKKKKLTVGNLSAKSASCSFESICAAGFNTCLDLLCGWNTHPSYIIPLHKKKGIPRSQQLINEHLSLGLYIWRK